MKIFCNFFWGSRFILLFSQWQARSHLLRVSGEFQTLEAFWGNSQWLNPTTTTTLKISQTLGMA
jgi:hypothetical protein